MFNCTCIYTWVHLQLYEKLYNQRKLCDTYNYMSAYTNVYLQLYEWLYYLKIEVYIQLYLYLYHRHLQNYICINITNTHTIIRHGFIHLFQYLYSDILTPIRVVILFILEYTYN